MIKASIYILFFISPLIVHAREKVYSEKTWYGWAIFMVIAIIVILIREGNKNK